MAEEIVYQTNPLDQAILNQNSISHSDENQNHLPEEHHREDEGFFKFLENCWLLYDRRTMILIAL